ncbi:MAG: tetratricopeptide repeat protein [Bdellovibrionota bacterium]
MLQLVTKVFKLIVVVSISCLFISCSGSKSPTDRRLDLLERDLQDIRNFQAEQTTQLSSLHTELNSLRGNIEELQYKSQTGNRELNTGDPRASADLNPGMPSQPRLPDASSILSPPPAIVPQEFTRKDLKLAETLPGRNGQLLKKSIEQVSEGKFLSANPSLEELRDLSYGADWGAVVLFWLGVSSEGLLDNKKAVSYYHELVTSYPRHERTSVAMLRQGSVLIRVRDTDTAKLIFQKLITDFPNSPAADKARARLQDL